MRENTTSDGQATEVPAKDDPVAAPADAMATAATDPAATGPLATATTDPAASAAAPSSTKLADTLPAGAPLRQEAVISEGPVSEPEAIEVEPMPVVATASSHHPPPPPSIRASTSTRSLERLEVLGEPKLAQDLMTRRIFTIGPSDVIAHIEEHMQAFRFRHLPVVEDSKLVGLITHGDLLHASSSFLSKSAPEEDAIIHKLPASRIMQRELITVRPTDTLAEVAVLMWEAKIGCVLVTEEDGTLVGIVTEADFLRLAHHFLKRASH